MFKKIFILFIILFFPYFCWAKFNLPAWRYYKDIEVKPGWNMVKIDDEVFANSSRGLRDLRVINNHYEEVPYKIVVSQDKDEFKTYRPKMLNNSYLPGKYSSVVLDLGANPEPVNRLRINTVSENFQRNVMIYGSDDMKSWQIIKDDAYIYDYTDKRGHFHAQNTVVDFPESIFRYLKLEIADRENNPVKINSVNINYCKKEPAREVKKKPKFSVRNKPEGKTEIYVDLGSGGLPVKKIKLFINNDNFNRPVELLASFSKRDWRTIGNYYIFRYNTNRWQGQNLSLDFSESNERYFKIIIFNKDDKPLKISELEFFAVCKEIVFSAEKDEAYRLYYGNPQADFPEYDLEKYFSYLDLSDAYRAKLSAQQENQKFQPEFKKKTSRSEQISNLLEYGIIVASILLLFLLYRFFVFTK